MKSTFENAVKRIVNQLHAVAWTGTPKQYGIAGKAANLLANAIGARKADNERRKPRTSRRRAPRASGKGPAANETAK